MMRKNLSILSTSQEYSKSKQSKCSNKKKILYEKFNGQMADHVRNLEFLKFECFCQQNFERYQKSEFQINLIFIYQTNKQKQMKN